MYRYILTLTFIEVNTFMFRERQLLSYNDIFFSVVVGPSAPSAAAGSTPPASSAASPDA